MTKGKLTGSGNARDDIGGNGGPEEMKTGENGWKNNGAEDSNSGCEVTLGPRAQDM